ncbi:hypothetical protein MBLNU459_g7820t2 [Dothideomycetes sp. NU459]
MSEVTVKSNTPFSKQPSALHHGDHVVAEVCGRLPAGLIKHVEELPGHSQRIHQMTMSGGGTILLKCPPRLTTRLLRQERQGVANEAKILGVLSSSSRTSVPKILSYELLDSASAHLLIDCGTSVPFSSIGSLMAEDMEILQKSMVSWLQSTNSIRSDFFGMISAGPQSFHTPSWKSCFSNLFEMALQDAENGIVSLPYDRIRWHVWRHGDCLDAVVTPRLLVMSALDLENVMVDPVSMEMTGLLNYSNALWGDPELALFHIGSDAVEFDMAPQPQSDNAEKQMRHLL